MKGLPAQLSIGVSSFSAEDPGGRAHLADRPTTRLRWTSSAPWPPRSATRPVMPAQAADGCLFHDASAPA
jgi:hypothetical protein